MMRRIVSIWLPFFSLERLKRDEPDAVPPDLPFALVASQANRMVISAATPNTLHLGITPGMGFADARAIVPALATRQAEPARDAAALARLARWLERYGSAFNTDGTDALWVDVTGVGHLFGGEGPLLADLTQRLKSLNFSAYTGLGESLGTAWALARYVQENGCRRRAAAPNQPDQSNILAELPVEALRLEASTTLLLRRLGLKSVGQLHAMPRTGLERRFRSKAEAGAVVLRLDQMFGIRPEPLRPMRKPTRHCVRTLFHEPLLSSQGLQAALAELSDTLCAGLQSAHRGARRLRLTLHRADASRIRISAGLSRPGRSAAHMLRLLRAKLDDVDAGFGIDLMQLSAPATEPLPPAQTSLPSKLDQTAGSKDGEVLAALIDRLAGRLGSAGVLTLAPQESHLPERAETFVPALLAIPGPAKDLLSSPKTTRRPPILLTAPEPIGVVAGVPEGPPELMRWRGRLRRITRAQGPERIAPEWWHEIGSATSGTRDYYTVEDDAGARFWVFRDGKDGDGTMPVPAVWYVQGLWG